MFGQVVAAAIMRADGGTEITESGTLTILHSHVLLLGSLRSLPGVIYLIIVFIEVCRCLGC